MRDVLDRDFIALLDRAASESAYRLGGAHRALRGVRPSVRRRWELVIVAGVAGFVGVMAVLTARRWMAKVGELIRALELADSERVLGPDHPDTLTCRRNLELARTSRPD